MSPILGIWASSKAVATDTGAMFPLQVITVGPASAADVTFTNIPTTGYSHLQVRYSVLSPTTGADLAIRVGNGSIDTGSNYTLHLLGGNGSSAYANGYANEVSFKTGFSQASTTAPAVGVVDFLDYADANKFKTMRALGGQDKNGSGDVQLASGVWRSTSAINQLRLYFPGGTLAQYSQVSLYAVKGA